MRFIDVSALLALLGAVGQITKATSNSDGVMDNEVRALVKLKFSPYQNPLAEFNFSASKATLKRLLVMLDAEDTAHRRFGETCDELRQRLIDETNGRNFFSMTQHEAQFYEQPRRGWDLAIGRFPSIIDDVEEAAKCFALSRYAGAVFHSVQVVEVGLIELGKFLKVNDPMSGWSAVANSLQKVLDKKHGERTSFERKNFSFLEQTHGTVAGLKNAWRNKISHAHGKLAVMTKEFSPEVSEEILIATRAFMRRLAEGLPPIKKIRSGSQV